jgi:hypothetical protein
VGWRVTSTLVRAPPQARRRQDSGVSGPAQPGSPPRPCWRTRLSSSMVTVSCGRTPPVRGSGPPSRLRRASSVRASARRCPLLRSSSALWGRASGSSAASKIWAASGSSSPSTATIPSGVAASHRPRRWCCRSVREAAASGLASSRRWATTRRRCGGSSRRAAATSTGSASAVVWTGRSWVPWASTEAWAGESSPSVNALAVADSGPRNRARATRTRPLVSAAPMRSRPRSQPAVEGAGAPRSAPAAPRASVAVSCWSQRPSRRFSSSRSWRTCSARAASVSRSRSWVASSSTAVASAAIPPGDPPVAGGEQVFESMTATYQARCGTQTPSRNLGTSSGGAAGRPRATMT